MGKTNIPWATDVWNPITGCYHSGSPGCDHCYAKRMANRLQKMGVKGYEHGFKITPHPERL